MGGVCTASAALVARSIFFFPEASGRKVVFLSIDDSPTSNTIELLTVLRKYRVKASFFVISESFNKHEIGKDSNKERWDHSNFNEIVRMISEDGHITIGFSGILRFPLILFFNLIIE